MALEVVVHLGLGIAVGLHPPYSVGIVLEASAGAALGDTCQGILQIIGIARISRILAYGARIR